MSINKQWSDRAAQFGYKLKELPDGGILAEGQPMTFIGPDTVKTVKLVEKVVGLKEYPWVKIENDGEAYVTTVGGEEVERGEDLEAVIADTIDQFPEPPEGFEMPVEEEEPGSIVPASYKREYKARGDETRCSDWLCEVIDPLVTLPMMSKGRVQKEISRRTVNLEALRILCKANGVDKDWPSLNNGQRSMNMRNMLRSKVVTEGKIILPAELTGGIARTVEADPEWLEKRR